MLLGLTGWPRTNYRHKDAPAEGWGSDRDGTLLKAMLEHDEQRDERNHQHEDGADEATNSADEENRLLMCFQVAPEALERCHGRRRTFQLYR